MNNVTYTEIVNTLRTALATANFNYLTIPSATHFDAQLRASLAFQAVNYTDKSKQAQILATARSCKPGALTAAFLQEVAFSISTGSVSSLNEVMASANKAIMAAF